MTKYNQVPTSTAQYDPEPPSTHLPYTDPAPQNANKYCPQANQYHQVPNSIWKHIDRQIFAHQLDVISIHIRGWIRPGLLICFFLQFYVKVGMIPTLPLKMKKRHKKLAFLSCTNLTQVSTSFYNIKKLGASFSRVQVFIMCPLVVGAEIETRWDEKFFNIEWRLGTWGGLWVVRKTIAMWAAALLRGSPNYLSIHPAVYQTIAICLNDADNGAG